MYETMIPTAEELGYKVTEEELRGFANAGMEQLSEEDMGKVAGGTSCIPAIITAQVLVTTYFGLKEVEEKRFEKKIKDMLKNETMPRNLTEDL